MHGEKNQPSTPTAPAPTAYACTCERPLPRERAERKGAATTVCDRCGLPVPVRKR